MPTSDGILAVRPDDTVFFNIRAVEIWSLPELELPAWTRLGARGAWPPGWCDPDRFRQRVAELDANPGERGADLLEFKDGRVIERRVEPQWVQGRPVGSVVVYRDVTEQARHGREMAFNSRVLENSGPMFVDRA